MNEKEADVLNRIQLARRDIRVTAAGLRPTPDIGAGARAERFVRAILARYRALTVGRLATGLVFHHPASSPGPQRVTWQHVTHRHQLTLAPRVALSLLAWPGAVEKPGPVAREARSAAFDTGSLAGLQSAPQVRAPNRVPTALIRLASLATPAAASHLEDESLSARGEASPREVVRYLRDQGRIVIASNPLVVRAMLSRTERLPSVESGPGAATAGRPPAWPIAAAAPVPRVVRRPPTLAPEAENSPTASLHSLRSLRSPHPQTDTDQSQLPELDSFQISRLADQVVQVIDGRIIAQRERFGRM